MLTMKTRMGAKFVSLIYSIFIFLTIFQPSFCSAQNSEHNSQPQPPPEPIPNDDFQTDSVVIQTVQSNTEQSSTPSRPHHSSSVPKYLPDCSSDEAIRRYFICLNFLLIF